MNSPTIKEINSYLSDVDKIIKKLEQASGPEQQFLAEKLRNSMSTAGILALKFISEHWREYGENKKP